MNANEVEKKFGFLVFHGLEELDLVGPWEMISLWGKSLQGPGTRLLVAQTRDPVVCAKGMSINPQITFNECPQLDYLLVPGGEGTREQVNNEALIRFVAGQAKACQAVLSVCTGSFILHRAGLLSGRRATTHWSALSRLTEPGATSCEVGTGTIEASGATVGEAVGVGTAVADGVAEGVGVGLPHATTIAARIAPAAKRTVDLRRRGWLAAITTRMMHYRSDLAPRRDP